MTTKAKLKHIEYNDQVYIIYLSRNSNRDEVAKDLYLDLPGPIQGINDMHLNYDHVKMDNATGLFTHLTTLHHLPSIQVILPPTHHMPLERSTSLVRASLESALGHPTGYIIAHLLDPSTGLESNTDLDAWINGNTAVREMMKLEGTIFQVTQPESDYYRLRPGTPDGVVAISERTEIEITTEAKNFKVHKSHPKKWKIDDEIIIDHDSLALGPK